MKLTVDLMWLAIALAAFVVCCIACFVVGRHKEGFDVIALIKKVLKDCNTEANGSYDIVRVMTTFVCVTGVPAALGLEITSVIMSPDHHFNVTEFCGGLTLLLGGLAGTALGIAQKQKTD